MLIITHDTDKVFNRELGFCAQKDETWRCIVFRFSQAPGMPEGWFMQAIDKIQYCLGENSGWVFLFEDQDLHVLSRQATQKSFLFLLTHLQPVLAPVSVRGLASLYELPVDMEALKNVRKKEEGGDEDAELEFTKLILDIEPQHQPLIGSIAERREQRKDAGVLVVEDDFFSKRQIRRALHGHFEIFTASTALEIVASYVNNAPDIVFMDIDMLGPNYMYVLLKIFEVDPQAHVVMVGESTSQENMATAMKNGARGFISKPFSRAQLVRQINQCESVQQKQAKKPAQKWN